MPSGRVKLKNPAARNFNAGAFLRFKSGEARQAGRAPAKFWFDAGAPKTILNHSPALRPADAGCGGRRLNFKKTAIIKKERIMELSDIGLVGLGVMGENLALNMESKGFRVTVFNRAHPGRESAVERFMKGRAAGRNFAGTENPADLVASLKSPRKIMLMVKAGAAVDSVIETLVPLLDRGDVIIDGGNSDFRDTERRVKDLADRGILFVGAGVSGGEEGALRGPSIMPGGNPEAWPLARGILQAVAAHLDDGSPCCEWMGPGGAGHFVKMVHNGIEYGDMQLIAEAYSVLKTGAGLDNEELARVFGEFNKGELDSFLIEITSKIMNFRDPNGGYLLDSILDVAGQKGTGKWTVQAALDENVPLSLITEAVYARFMSGRDSVRAKAEGIFSQASNPLGMDRPSAVAAVEKALYAAKMISYAQGFSLMASASEKHGWNLDFAAIARIWRKGCIIRAKFLTKISEAYGRDPKLENLLFDGFFADKVRECLGEFRAAVSACALAGIPVPCMSSALSYFDSLRRLDSSANLIQAQRDYFGAHTYERRDAPRGEFFHTDWANTGGKTRSGTYNV